MKTFNALQLGTIIEFYEKIGDHVFKKNPLADTITMVGFDIKGKIFYMTRLYPETVANQSIFVTKDMFHTVVRGGFTTYEIPEWPVQIGQELTSEGCAFNVLNISYEIDDDGSSRYMLDVETPNDKNMFYMELTDFDGF